MCRDSAKVIVVRRSKLLAGVAALAGCSGIQSALDPAGPEAEALARITWIMTAGAAAILLLVMGLAAYAMFRAPGKRRRVSSCALIVGGGIVFPVAVLSVLLVYGVHLTGDLRAPGAPGALRVHVTGHMWWWEVRYADGEGRWITTANELRIPVGRPVALSFSSHDVIHSFWVTSLAGKIDMIPGRHTDLTLRAERAGSYRGQCAEFCGAQHALMAFHVVAVASEEFARWLEGLRAPARPPSGEQALLGRKAFLEQGCAACHTVRGLVEGKVPAPDLTHVGSRSWIGAGTLPNTREHMVAWLAHGESLKPGRAMPSYSHLEPATLAALAEYLAGLE